MEEFAIPQDVLIRVFVEDLKTNQNRIRHMMPELGWRSEHVKWGGVDYARAIWVHPDYQVAQGHVRGPDGYEQPIRDPVAETLRELGFSSISEGGSR